MNDPARPEPNPVARPVGGCRSGHEPGAGAVDRGHRDARFLRKARRNQVVRRAGRSGPPGIVRPHRLLDLESALTERPAPAFLAQQALARQGVGEGELGSEVLRAGVIPFGRQYFRGRRVRADRQA
jgi:hypothetical protein